MATTIPIEEEYVIPAAAFKKCPTVVEKPKDPVVSKVLKAWQEDRNKARQCQKLNDEKTSIIEELVYGHGA